MYIFFIYIYIDAERENKIYRIKLENKVHSGRFMYGGAWCSCV